MKITETKLPGVYICEPDFFADDRGSFMKSFHKDSFEKVGLKLSLGEIVYSTSKKNVIRGMHFQIPPKAQAKFLGVVSGAITEVVVDLRKKSPAYGQFVTYEMSAENRLHIFVPEGCAHGFVAREDNTCVAYVLGGMRSPEHESGINHEGFGMNWNVQNPIISDKDTKLPLLKDFKTPFV